MKIFCDTLILQAYSISTTCYSAFRLKPYVVDNSRLFAFYSTLTHISSVMHLIMSYELMHKTHMLYYSTYGYLSKNNLKSIHGNVLPLGYFNFGRNSNLPNMIKNNENRRENIKNVCTSAIVVERLSPLLNSSLRDLTNFRVESVPHIKTMYNNVMNEPKRLNPQLKFKRDVLCSSRNVDIGGQLSKGNKNANAEKGKEKSIPEMTWKQWRHVFLSAAFPMIGFGVMDQLIMIRAGDLIDNTIGVTFGLATLSAAAVGQLCSDTSGVLFGNVIDSIVQVFGFSPPDVIQEQRGLPSFRLATTLGAAFGVAFGCILGMTQLFFMDLDKPERLKRQKELDTIFEMVMSDGPKLFHCERGTLFVYDKSKGEIWSKAVFGLEQAIRIHRNKSKSFTTWVLDNKEILNCKDACKDPRFNPVYDQKYKYKTRSVLAAPVIHKNGEVMAVLMFINKHEADGGVFTVDDERMMEMMCKHVQIFMEKFDYGAADDKRMISLKEEEVFRKEEDIAGKTPQILGKNEKVDKAFKSNESLSTMSAKSRVNVSNLTTSSKDVSPIGTGKNTLQTHNNSVHDFYKATQKLKQWLSSVSTESGGEYGGVSNSNESKQGYRHSCVSIGRCVESDTLTSGLPFLSSLSLSYVCPFSLSLKSSRDLPSNVPSTTLLMKNENNNNNNNNNSCTKNSNDLTNVSTGIIASTPVDSTTTEHKRPPYWNLHYPHLYDYQHHLTGKIVEINRGEDF